MSGPYPETYDSEGRDGRKEISARVAKRVALGGKRPSEAELAVIEDAADRLPQRVDSPPQQEEVPKIQ